MCRSTINKHDNLHPRKRSLLVNVHVLNALTDLIRFILVAICVVICHHGKIIVSFQRKIIHVPEYASLYHNVCTDLPSSGGLWECILLGTLIMT